MGRNDRRELLPGGTTDEVGGFVQTTRRRHGADGEIDPPKRKKSPRNNPRSGELSPMAEDLPLEASHQVSPTDSSAVSLSEISEETKEGVQPGSEGISSTDIHQGRGSFRPRELNSDGGRDPEENPVASIRALRAEIEEQVKHLTRQLKKNQKLEFEVDGQPIMTEISLVLARARTISDEYFEGGRMKEQGNGRKKEVKQALQATLDELKEYQEQITFALIQDAEVKLGMATSPRPVVVEGTPPKPDDVPKPLEALFSGDNHLQSPPNLVAPRKEKFLLEIFNDSIPQEAARELWDFLDDEMRKYRREMRAWMKKEKVPIRQQLKLLNHPEAAPRFLESLLKTKLKMSGLVLSTEVTEKLREVMRDYMSKV